MTGEIARDRKVAHLVCFRIGDETFGVDIFAVQEIVRLQQITRVPGAPEYVLGVINLRGRIITVVDLGERLGLGRRQSGRSSRILVVNLDGSTVGFLVDFATEVVKLPATAIEPAPETAGSVDCDYVEGVGKLDDRLVILLNLERVLGEGIEGLEAREAVAAGRTE